MTTNPEINTQRSRRWLYGFNFVLIVLVSIVLLGFAMYLTAAYTKSTDATSAGLYSLSPKTKKLLEEVDKSGKKIEILNLFGDPTVSSGDDASRVADLLREYQRNSKSLVVNSGLMDRATVEQKIKDRYADEIKPYEQAVRDFDGLITKLENFFKTEGANIAQVPPTTPDAKEELASLQSSFSSAIPTSIAKVKRDINKATESTLPEWSSAIAKIKSLIDLLDQQFKFFTNEKAMTEGGLSKPVIEYFKTAKPGWEGAAKLVADYRTTVNALPELKVQTVLDSLSRDSVVILADKSARVIDRSSIFKFQPEAAGNEGQKETFEGEQAISSALLNTLRPEKIKIVFVSPSPAQLTTGMFSEMATRLKDANFEVLEWSPAPARNPMQPQDPGAGGPPPAEGKGVIWIIYPPEPLNPQMLMMGMPPPDAKPVVDAALQHIAKGGNTLIFAEAAGMSMPDAESSFPYAELIKPFGIDVKAKYTLVSYRPVSQNRRQATVETEISRYPQHEITKPVQGLRSVVAGSPTRMGVIGGPTLVTIAQSKPANVESAVFLQSPADSDHWAESKYDPDATFDKTADEPGPVNLAVAAIKDKAVKDKEQRMAVIGVRFLGHDGLVRQRYMIDEDGRLRVDPRTPPGNAELYQNTVLWLAGYENMIAVSAKVNVAQRIRDIEPNTLFALRTFLIAGVPILTLVAGGIVWFMRRR